MSDSILKLIVEATPTEKDDELLAVLMDMSRKYPFLKEFLFDMLMQLIMKKA